MKRFVLLVTGFLISSVPLFAQTSFDDYFAVAKLGKSPNREQSFTSACGLSRSNASLVYSVSTENEGWKWRPKSSLGHGRDDAQTDFYGTAVVWKIDGKPRFVNVWILIMDTGNTNNEMFCLDEQGRVTAQESLNSFEPVDGSVGGWRYIQQTNFLASGRKRVVQGNFVDKAGHSIATPTLGKEDMQNARVSLAPALAHDVIAQLSH